MKTVHLLGMGGGWDLCPKEGEVWTVNKGCVHRDTSLIFFMDRALLYDTDIDDPEAVEELEKRVSCPLYSLETVEHFVMRVVREENTPVVTTRAFDDIPNNIVFPLEEIVKKYGSDYFGNSLDYMIAYALYTGYDDIHLYGVNMGSHEISKYEKSPLSFWLGMAMGLGCRISTHGALSEVLVVEGGYLYAYDKKQWIQRDKGMQRKL